MKRTMGSAVVWAVVAVLAALPYGATGVGTNDMPYSDSFESRSVGDSIYDVQGWSGDTNYMAIVTNISYTYTYTRPLEAATTSKVLYVDGGAVSNDLSGPSAVSYVDFIAQHGFVEDTNNIAVDATALCGFYVNTNGHLVLRHKHDDGSSLYERWTEFDSPSIASDQWVRVTVQHDPVTQRDLGQSFALYCFKIFIDTNALTSEYGYDDSYAYTGQWFIALRQENTDSLKKYVLSGRGKLDDLVVTTNTPNFLQPSGPPPSTYTITVTYGSQGTITPSGAVVVDAGGTTNFVIAADSYYHISDIITNGMSLGGFGSTSNYVWSSINANGTLHADFSVNLGANGTPETFWGPYMLPGDDTDADGDGHLTSQEYVTHTDPTNKESVLKADVQVIDGSNVVKWTGVINANGKPNSPYGVRYRTNIQEGDWTQAGGDITRVAGPMSYEEPLSGEKKFWQVVCTNAP